MIPKILVVDDEPDALELLEFNLQKAGFQVQTADDGAEALRIARAVVPDVVLLDLMLPEITGLDVFKLLRRDPATAGIPVIMVTAKAAEIDRVLGLELGADDYVTKPFSPRELVLRVKNLIERKQAKPENEGQIRYGELFIDIPRHLVKVGDRRVELTATEFKLLTTLALRRGVVQDRDRLLKEVWEYDGMIDTRTVDTHMVRLRGKLGPEGKRLETVRGLGYRFAEE